MNRTQYRLMAMDIRNNRENLAKYRKIFKYAYPFGDEIFKRLMINQVNPERFIAFLNAMMSLEGNKRIKEFTFRVQEIPSMPSQKKPLFDIIGTNQAGETVLVEVQQNVDSLFIDRLFYYVSRAISTLVPEGKKYNLPHVYLLSILTEDLFQNEPDTYFHHVTLSRNGNRFYEKFDGFLVEVDKFAKIDSRTPKREKEQSERAEMLRFFIQLMNETPLSPQFLQSEMYAKLTKDVSLERIEDELFLREVDNMIDLEYAKAGAFLEGEKAGIAQTRREMVKAMLADGLPAEKISAYSGLSKEDVLALRG